MTKYRPTLEKYIELFKIDHESNDNKFTPQLAFGLLSDYLEKYVFVDNLHKKDVE